MELIRHMRSAIPVEGGKDIPLLPIYPQFRALLLQEFHADRPIIVSVRRIELIPSDDPVADDPLEVELEVPVEPNFTYRFGDARVLLFKPNHKSGRFEITPEEMETPGLRIDAWSTYHAGSKGRGLDAADHDEYFNALSMLDLAWLILQYAATHAPYTSKAKDKSPHYGPLYDSVCQPQAQIFDYDREHCEGFNLNINIQGEERPNLAKEWAMATLSGAARGLTKCQFVKMGDSQGGSFVRINRSVDFQIDHVHSFTSNQAKARCEALRDMHAQAENAIIGRYVVRMGGYGVSCLGNDFADLLPGNKNSAKKKTYLEKYPENAVFLRE